MEALHVSRVYGVCNRQHNGSLVFVIQMSKHNQVVLRTQVYVGITLSIKGNTSMIQFRYDHGRIVRKRNKPPLASLTSPWQQGQCSRSGCLGIGLTTCFFSRHSVFSMQMKCKYKASCKAIYQGLHFVLSHRGIVVFIEFWRQFTIRIAQCCVFPMLLHSDAHACTFSPENTDLA